MKTENENFVKTKKKINNNNNSSYLNIAISNSGIEFEIKSHSQFNSAWHTTMRERERSRKLQESHCCLG